MDVSDYSFVLISIDDYIYTCEFKKKIVHLSIGMQLTLVFIIESSVTRVKRISAIYVTMIMLHALLVQRQCYMIYTMTVSSILVHV